MQPLLPLELLPAGSSALIADLDGDPGEVARLQEMGLRIGATIRMIQPGEPCVVALHERRVSYRPAGGMVIFVEPIEVRDA